MRQVGLGLRARKGGAVVVGLDLEDGRPRVLISTLLATGADGDRLSLEPYRLAAEMARDRSGAASVAAAAAVAEGRRRQNELAVAGLQRVLQQLDEAGFNPVVAALLVNRAGWVTDLLAYSSAWPEHVPVAEGLAVRAALRFAIQECRLETAELDEKSVFDRAENVLGLSSTQIDARLKDLGSTAGTPWRKEQKLACVAAWIAITASTS